MTAEETALEEFREAVADVRRLTRICRCGVPARAARGEAMWHVHSLARIIRAIRAEDRGDRMRASYEASVSEQVIHAETAWYDRGYEQGYAQGRRDALRGVQGACLFEAGDGNPFFTSDEDAIRGVALLDVAKAAEEAAR